MKITHHKHGDIKTLVEEAPYHPGYEDAGFKPDPEKLAIKPEMGKREHVAWLLVALLLGVVTGHWLIYFGVL